MPMLRGHLPSLRLSSAVMRAQGLGQSDALLCSMRRTRLQIVAVADGHSVKAL